ncbi:spermatogenesis-associated protein 2-like protein isoform X1 [Arapaima gigas]
MFESQSLLFSQPFVTIANCTKPLQKRAESYCLAATDKNGLRGRSSRTFLPSPTWNINSSATSRQQTESSSSFQNPGASLGGLARTFEVLELVALNLYLCPWRKEYKVVKLFSGMFIHQVCSVLSKQQAMELFRWLGYQAVERQGHCEKLELKGPSLPIKALLHFAYLFFIARCECRLLQAAAEMLGGGPTVELALVQERQRGCSLETAQHSLQSKMEVTQLEENLEVELDLYTAEASSSESGAASMTETQPTLQKEGLYQSCSVSELPKGGNRGDSGGKAGCGSIFQHQFHGDWWAGSSKTSCLTELKSTSADLLQAGPVVSGTPHLTGVTQGQCLTCGCSGSSLYMYVCEQCHVHHNKGCADLRKCDEKGHPTRLSSFGDTAQQPRRMSAPSKERVHGAEEEPKDRGRGGYVEWHTCIRDPLVFFICHTCNLIHQLMCTEACLYHHDLELLKLSLFGVSFSSAHVTAHQCVLKALGPNWICQVCKAFHIPTCGEMERCRRSHHDTRALSACSAKEGCLGSPHLLCRSCFSVYCKECWLSNSLSCSCGWPFCTTTAV